MSKLESLEQIIVTEGLNSQEIGILDEAATVSAKKTQKKSRTSQEANINTPEDKTKRPVKKNSLKETPYKLEPTEVSLNEDDDGDYCSCGNCAICRGDDEEIEEQIFLSLDEDQNTSDKKMEEVPQLTSMKEDVSRNHSSRICFKTPTKKQEKLKNVSGKYSCQECSEEFSSLKEISNHLGSQHVKNIHLMDTDFWSQFSGKGFCTSCLLISENERCAGCTGVLQTILEEVPLPMLTPAGKSSPREVLQSMFQEVLDLSGTRIFSRGKSRMLSVKVLDWTWMTRTRRYVQLCLKARTRTLWKMLNPSTRKERDQDFCKDWEQTQVI